MKRFGSILLCIVLVIGLCCSCSAEKSKKGMQLGVNLLADSNSKIQNGEAKGKGFLGRQGTVYTAEFEKETKINTVVLEEKTSNTEGFKIEAEVNGEFEPVYEQDDKIGSYRYCAFPSVEATALRITLLGSKADVEIKGISAYDVASREKGNFRVTTYITVEQAYNREVLKKQEGSLDVITDIIFFGSARFDASGQLWFNKIEINGQLMDGKTVFEAALQNVKELIGTRDINLYCNFIGPDAPEGTPGEDWAKEKCNQHNLAMKDNQDAFIQNLLDFTAENQFSGIFFDYEYPKRLKDWTIFSKFLKELRKAADGSCKLGAATPVWKHVSIPSVLKSLDLAEVMGYDSFDDSGYHASFSATAAELMDDYRKMTKDMEKVDLGVPFYARPTDGAAFWFEYSLEAAELGKCHNIATGPIESADWDDNGTKKTRDISRYYNGYQMIYDKTAYAIDSGVGGIMTWNYGYDLPFENDLSLFRAIQQAIEDRTA